MHMPCGVGRASETGTFCCSLHSLRRLCMLALLSCVTVPTHVFVYPECAGRPQHPTTPRVPGATVGSLTCPVLAHRPPNRIDMLYVLSFFIPNRSRWSSMLVQT